ncbi:FRG domain-containing protein [Uliginosibacterium sp. 31-16]|uniref:FRG domain-containing protein n=1 Tax=Uliginosibacterium sp. 31-16 TaxID=3068315 RepID=UPI00273D5DDD|nr:FRG domain-containing protein [Uliginosibacterium sp. 31-16]MDP5239920.1 FRG domain-containing protein [Uliginosibacterium sp. 31-16]
MSQNDALGVVGILAMVERKQPVAIFEQTEIKSVTELVERVSSIELFVGDMVLYRGQSRQGNLLPGVCRNNPDTNTTSLEWKALQQLKIFGAAIHSDMNTTNLDWLVWAQHFGMKTRLLDWTSNPLAALWFACNSKESGDVWLYAWDFSRLHVEDFYNHELVVEESSSFVKAVDDPFSLKSTMVFQPRLSNKRVQAQHGWFSIHRFSQKHNRFICLENNSEAENTMAEFKIQGRSRVNILWELDKLGVNERTLFPDEDGLCSYLNYKLKLGK